MANDTLQARGGATPLIAVVGPTASGKSALALGVARILKGEIVNCDSMQMYRHMEVGTAKPSAAERRLVEHHLYDIIDPDEYYSAGRYMAEARNLCLEIACRGKIPLVVGGTGLYLRALLDGLFEGPGRSEEVRERLHRIGSHKGDRYLYELLRKKDPRTAERLQPGDGLRVIRALEVYFLTGDRMSDLQQRREPFTQLAILKVGVNLSRAILYDRIERRVDQMFQSGLLDEVVRLIKQGYGEGCKGFEALGYRHAAAVLAGQSTVDQAVELTKRDTRRYAKRQLTWFRKEPDMHWVQAPGETPEALEQVLRIVDQPSAG